MNQNQIVALLQSKTPAAKFLGLGALLIFFVPAFARVMDDPALSTWKRVEQLAIAAGNTFAVVIVAAIPPEALREGKD